MPEQEPMAPPHPPPIAPPIPLRRPDAPKPNPAVVPGGPAFARQQATHDADPLSQANPVRSPFTPTQPVQSGAALIGRRPQIERAIAAVETERAHVAIFGERGHGKTSLANIVAGLAEDAGYGVVRHACSAGGSFSDLIAAIVGKIPARYLHRVGADSQEETKSDHPPEWNVDTATMALERIRFGQVLIFVDEFDRLAAPNARRDMAELLKNCSDLGLRASFVLIGVAESLGDLLALHQSIHRNLVAIPMPLLTDADLSLLLTQGCERLGLRLEWEAEKLLRHCGDRGGRVCRGPPRPGRDAPCLRRPARSAAARSPLARRHHLGRPALRSRARALRRLRLVHRQGCEPAQMRGRSAHPDPAGLRPPAPCAPRRRPD